VRGDRLLLEEELQAVGGELEDAQLDQRVTQDRDVRDAGDARAVRADPALNPAGDLALGHDRVARDGHRDDDHQHAVDNFQ
jgi:hypothetical protein